MRRGAEGGRRRGEEDGEGRKGKEEPRERQEMREQADLSYLI